MTFTRQQIEAIEVGKTMVQAGFDGRYGEATVVTSIHAKQEDIYGNAQMSFSIKEGDDDRFIRLD